MTRVEIAILYVVANQYARREEVLVYYMKIKSRLGWDKNLKKAKLVYLGPKYASKIEFWQEKKYVL